ncbi:serine/threonine protein kinase [Streptomyces sp. NPDC001591]|uniref:serine/threonine protein kinase n=1 Tax=Streptomyces sp. NPDC001591 TaxID=3364589 RepID=UPI003682E73E
MDGVTLPQRIGDYAVERELGAGGMGTVYLARSRGGRAVAVKVARPELAADPHFRARFRAEVAAARRVGGFHTAQVIDADPDAPAPWLATAYIAGPTLSKLLTDRGPMDQARLRLLGAALAEALQAIHDCGLVHRDLKPGNIIMADDGPRVLDFGIARALESTRLTSTGAAFGTPGFLAPEQAQGFEVGPAADVFALGAVLVAAAGGQAFGEGTPMMLMYRAVHEPADLSALPDGIRSVVATCLAKDPTQRPTTSELLDLLAPHTAGEPAAEVPVLRPMPASPAPSPRPAPTAWGAATPNAGGITEALDAGSRLRPALNRGAKAVIVAGALFVLGGVGYAVLTAIGSGWRPDTSFPTAAYQLVTPETLADAAYERKTGSLLPARPQPDNSDRKGSTEYGADYSRTSTGREKGTVFRTVHMSGSWGRYKDPDKGRDSLIRAMTVTGRENVSDPLRTIVVPGSDVTFRCTTVDDTTVCGWGDYNTTVAIAFTPTGSLEEAAEETSRIPDDIRKPIAQRL